MVTHPCHLAKRGICTKCWMAGATDQWEQQTLWQPIRRLYCVQTPSDWTRIILLWRLLIHACVTSWTNMLISSQVISGSGFGSDELETLQTFVIFFILTSFVHFSPSLSCLVFKITLPLYHYHHNIRIRPSVVHLCWAPKWQRFKIKKMVPFVKT